MDTRTKRDFCFRDWQNLSAVFEMSKIGPRPLLGIMIQNWGGVVLNKFYIYRYTIQLQFRQIPMTAVAVVHNGQLWIAVWLVSGCIVGRRLNKTCALTVPDFSDPGKYPEEYEWLA